MTKGLACVKKFEDVYHRVYVVEQHPSTCLLIYVDLGITEEVSATQTPFKHLLNYFASVPCIAIPCRLADIELKQDHTGLPEHTRAIFQSLCQGEPYNIVSCGIDKDQVLSIKIYDNNSNCLNDMLVQEGLATKRLMIDAYEDYENDRSSVLTSTVTHLSTPSNIEKPTKSANTREWTSKIILSD